MNRRDFVELLIKAAVAVNIPLDLGKELPVEIVEQAATISGLTNAQIVALQLERIRPTICKLFEQDDSFFAAIAKKEINGTTITEIREMRIPLEIRPGHRGKL